jgi:hypothetical protein
LTATVSYLPLGADGTALEPISDMFTLTPTADESGIVVQTKTLESLKCADVSVLDVRISLTYSGDPFSSATTPAIDAIAIPYIEQEPNAR